MRKTLKMWMQRKVAEMYNDGRREREGCGDIDSGSVYSILSMREADFWHCAELAGEYQIPPEWDWRNDAQTEVAP